MKGGSGNPRGRPKGAISTQRLTRKIAKRRVQNKGDRKRKTVFELMLQKLNYLAAVGHPGALELDGYYVSKAQPAPPKDSGGILLVPEKMTAEQSREMSA